MCKSGPKSLDDVRAIINDCAFLDRTFFVRTKGRGFLLSMQYFDPDIDSGQPAHQGTRQWYISPWATTSEIVQTALKCIITSQEHIAREHFKYKGQNVFHPHWNVEDLLKLHARAKAARRPPRAAIQARKGS